MSTIVFELAGALFARSLYRIRVIYNEAGITINYMEDNNMQMFEVVKTSVDYINIIDMIDEFIAYAYYSRCEEVNKIFYVYDAIATGNNVELQITSAVYKKFIDALRNIRIVTVIAIRAPGTAFQAL